MKSFASWTAAACIGILASAGWGQSPSPSSPGVSTRRGSLLIIGGALDDENRAVYERFVALARKAANDDSPRLVVATASSADEAAASKSRVEVLRKYCPTCPVDTIMRTTGRDETVAIVDEASGMFFTGGDQKRVTVRYLTEGGEDTPEARAMRRLLSRGGVIAGTSAGDAMMSDPMFLTGRSAEALGIRSTRAAPAADDDGDEKRPEPPLGPQIGRGMGFAPLVINDSHFFERHRFGRLVAALEVSQKRLGIGVSEDACVEFDLASGEIIGVSEAESLLVDVGGLKRDGLTRANVRTRVIMQGDRISLPVRLGERVSPAMNMPAETEEIAAEGRARGSKPAAGEFFVRAQNSPRVLKLKLDGYEQTAWPDGEGWAVVEITASETTPPAGKP